MIGVEGRRAKEPKTIPKRNPESSSRGGASRHCSFTFSMPPRSRSRPSRFLLGHPLPHVFLGFAFEVVAQLVQFLVRMRPAKQRPQPQGNRERPMLRLQVNRRFARRDAQASFSLITREMALESLPQLSASFSSCRRPSRVSE